jgi:ABC-type lipoprotein export system ATPase subunit
VHALRGVNLSVQPGAFLAIKGRSGSGKTTLLNCIGGLDQPTSGEVRVFNQALNQMDEQKLTAFRGQNIGFVFQAISLSPALSAYENVELMLRIAGASGRQRRERTLYCLDLVGLGKWKDHRPDELSGGQQQRVAIAWALANQPRILIADEPTGRLDTATGREILALFQRIVSEEGMTVLVASHDPLVDEFVDQTLSLKDGRLS